MKIQFISKSMVLLIIILLVSVLTACGTDKPAASDNSNYNSNQEQKKKEEIPLNIGTLKIAALTNLYAAEKLGYFKEQGLKVTFTQMGGGAELLPAVSAGKIDITLSIPSNAIQAREKGFDFKMVMQNEVSAKQGRDSQAVFIELPYPNMEDALLNKQVDAVFNVEPFTSKMMSNAKFKVISHPATESLPGQTLGAFWGSEKWLNANKQTVEKFVSAMNKANKYIKEQPEETQKLIAEYTGIKIEVIKTMNPILWSTTIDKATLQGLLDLMQKHGALKNKMDADSVLFSTALQ